ncbi:hypothetical protein MalM25_33360 [Planctomycetes bacterium MalM25]|nr:hypothetical protein MalM25_33360 [Planctomycetes bacterium MalM25]
MKSLVTHRAALACLAQRLAFGCLLTLSSGGAFAATATPVFEDRFEGREEIGEQYRTGRGHQGGWKVVEGSLVGEQVRSDHGATIRWKADYADLDLTFDFEFAGGTRFNVVFDDKKEKSVHAGHICRVSVSPRMVSLSDDKTGSMNLKVREMRKDKDLSQEKQAELQAILEETASKAKVRLKQGKRYTLRVRIEDDTMSVALDGKPVASLTSPGLAHPTKNELGFTVNGKRFVFDNIVTYDVAR